MGLVDQGAVGVESDQTNPALRREAWSRDGWVKT